MGSAASSSGVIKFDADGKLIDEIAMAEQAGLELGVVCKNSDGSVAVIRAIGGGLVKLQSMCGKTEHEAPYDTFLDDKKSNWKIVFDKTDIKDQGIIVNYRETLGEDNESMVLAETWAQLLVSFKAAVNWIKFKHPTPTFDMHTKPEKKLFLQQDAKALRFFSHLLRQGSDLGRARCY